LSCPKITCIAILGRVIIRFDAFAVQMQNRDPVFYTK
jgi:hypothetical protein